MEDAHANQATGSLGGHNAGVVVGSSGGAPSGPRGSVAESNATVPMSGRNINEIVRPRWSHLEYRWKLDNFWELRALACVEALEDENGGLIWSQRFGDKERGFWQLKLYPYGDLSPAGRGHISLFLSLDLKSLDVPKAYAIFGCYLLDDEGQKVANSGRSFTRQKFAEGSSSWGWSQFIKVEGQSLNRLLSGPNDSLIIKCEIEVFVGVMASPGRALPVPRKWEEEVHQYLENPVNYDVSMICEGRVVKGNSSVMCARSKWFEQQLANAGTRAPAATTKQGEAWPSKRADEVGNATDPFGARESTTNTSQPHPSSGQASLTYASFGGIDSLSTTIGADSFGATRTEGQMSALAATATGPGPSAISSAGEWMLEITECSANVLENVISFMHTDDCRYFAGEASLSELLDIFVASKRLAVESLYVTLLRRLCCAIVSKPSAIAIQEVAKQLDATELVDHCQAYLLMSVRELTDEELIKTLVPKPRN